MQETKKLFRQEQGKVIAGVCSGLAQYLNLDPVVVRVIFILLIFFQGAGILLYVALAILTPKEGQKISPIEVEGQKAKEKTKNLAEKFKQKKWLADKRKVLGIFCVLSGVAIILNHYFFEWFEWRMLWIASLIVVGFYLVITEPKQGQDA